MISTSPDMCVFFVLAKVTLLRGMYGCKDEIVVADRAQPLTANCEPLSRMHGGRCGHLFEECFRRSGKCSIGDALINQWHDPKGDLLYRHVSRTSILQGHYFQTEPPVSSGFSSTCRRGLHLFT